MLHVSGIIDIKSNCILGDILSCGFGQVKANKRYSGSSKWTVQVPFIANRSLFNQSDQVTSLIYNFRVTWA
jgi:hypothetical protein